VALERAISADADSHGASPGDHDLSLWLSGSYLTLARVLSHEPVGFQNPAARRDQRLQAAGS
jgi:hypothetical protein